MVVTVVSVRGDQVRLGIDAPRSVAVHRQEVAQAIEAANREALAKGELDPAALPQPAKRAEGPKNVAAGETG